MRSFRNGNGLNQIKIICLGRADANLLISSHELRIAGYKAFHPISMIRKNATIRDVDPRHSPSSTLNRLDPHSRDIVTAIRRRTNNDGAPSEIIEFTMETTSIPSSVSLAGFELELFPLIPPSRRCYTCQRLRHISNQCRFSRPCCEFCAGHHLTRDCSHGVLTARWSNSFGDHMASSRGHYVVRVAGVVMMLLLPPPGTWRVLLWKALRMLWVRFLNILRRLFSWAFFSPYSLLLALI